MCNFLQLNVLELFLDCITEPNEKLVEFGVGGICNASVGQSSCNPKCSLISFLLFPFPSGAAMIL